MLTKKDIIAETAKAAGYATSDTKCIVDALFEVISEQLIKGETIKIKNFGEFANIERGERQARNPQTNQPVIVPPCHVVKFTVAELLKNAVK